MAAHDEIDGIFIDSICKAVHPAFCPPDHEEAYIATANELRERLPEGKLLIGNALRAHMGGDCNMKHMKYLDGSYLEGWQKSNETIATTVKIMSAAAKQGRMIMLVSELEKFMDEEDAFRYQTSGLRARNYSSYPELIYLSFGETLKGLVFIFKNIAFICNVDKQRSLSLLALGSIRGIGNGFSLPLH
jgi:hypothetical protein